MSIEQQIAELIEEGKQLEAEQITDTVEEEATEVVSEEENLDEANAVTKDASAPESMNDIDAEEDDEEDNADNKKAADAKNDEVKTKKSSNEANKNANAGDQAMNKIKESMKEDLDAMFNGEELSEDFRSKAETIFEAAVVSRIKEEVAKLEESYEEKLVEATEEIAEGLVEKIDGYLGLMVEQWMEQNALALESGMKSDITEGFINGLKNLFEEHYIELPEERFDVLGDMESRVEELEGKLSESVDTQIAYKSELDALKKAQAIAEASEGLTDTEVEKFHALAEEISYEDVDTFGTKLQTIRENYFVSKAKADVESVVTDEPVAEEKVLSESMSRYTQAIGKTTFN